jgi:hypothetical protein
MRFLPFSRNVAVRDREHSAPTDPFADGLWRSERNIPAAHPTIVAGYLTDFR